MWSNVFLRVVYVIAYKVGLSRLSIIEMLCELGKVVVVILILWGNEVSKGLCTGEHIGRAGDLNWDTQIFSPVHALHMPL